MRFRNYVYKPNTSSFLNESDNFKYEATFVNMTDPLTFNYTSINYTTYSNYTSVINNTALKFGMATFNVQALSQETEANYIVIQITEPSSKGTVFESFEIEIFSYEKLNSSNVDIINFPENHYFYWLAGNDDGIINQTFTFNNAEYLYLELSPIPLKGNVSFFGKTSSDFGLVELTNVTNGTQNDKIILSVNIKGDFSQILMNVVYNSTEQAQIPMLGWDTNQMLCMLKYQTTEPVGTELVQLDWNVTDTHPVNDKTETTIRFPPIVAKNGLKLNKVIYIVRVYEFDYMSYDFYTEGATLPFNFITEPQSVYSKMYTDNKEQEIKISFFLDRGYFVYDIVAYVETNNNYFEFMKTTLFVFDVIYSEWEPLIVLASIVVGLLLLTGGYVTISKRIYRKRNLAQSGDFQSVESLNAENGDINTNE